MSFFERYGPTYSQKDWKDWGTQRFHTLRLADQEPRIQGTKVICSALSSPLGSGLESWNKSPGSNFTAHSLLCPIET